MKIAIIGAGVMGSAFARAWIEHKVVTPNELTLVDVDARKLAELKRRLKVNIARTVPHGTPSLYPSLFRERNLSADVILLAVKPQQMLEALKSIKETSPRLLLIKEGMKRTLLISIAAGVTSKTIERIVGKHQPVVRAMPNLPLTVGAGATAWCANRNVTRTQIKIATKLLSAGAEAIEVPERYLNAVTAVSGSGPGYVFAFADALVQAAHRAGLPTPIADRLVRATINGAGKMLKESNEAPAALAAQVASKGGATEAACKVLKRYKFEAMLQQAVKAAAKQAQELNT